MQPTTRARLQTWLASSLLVVAMAPAAPVFASGHGRDHGEGGSDHEGDDDDVDDACDPITGTWQITTQRVDKPFGPVTQTFHCDGTVTAHSGTDITTLGFDSRGGYLGEWRLEDDGLYRVLLEELLWKDATVRGRFLVELWVRLEDDGTITAGRHSGTDGDDPRSRFEITVFYRPESVCPLPLGAGRPPAPPSPTNDPSDPLEQSCTVVDGTPVTPAPDDRVRLGMELGMECPCAANSDILLTGWRLETDPFFDP